MVCVSGVGWRVRTPTVWGLGMMTHLNVVDIMKENGRVFKSEKAFYLVSSELYFILFAVVVP